MHVIDRLLPRPLTGTWMDVSRNTTNGFFQSLEPYTDQSTGAVRPWRVLLVHVSSYAWHGREMGAA